MTEMQQCAEGERMKGFEMKKLRCQREGRRGRDGDGGGWRRMREETRPKEEQQSRIREEEGATQTTILYLPLVDGRRELNRVCLQSPDQGSQATREMHWNVCPGDHDERS